MTTPSTVAYLFADRFVLTAQPGSKGMKAFGSGAVVVTAELSAGLVAIALWQLREQGAVTLEEYHAKKLGFIATNGVRVKLTDSTGADGVAGVEKRVLDELESTRKSRDAGVSGWDIANMICRNGDDAHGHVIKYAIDDAVAQGCLERVPQGVGVGGRLTGKPSTVLQPVADRISTLADAAQALALQWRDFRQGPEAGMAKLLRSTTFDGINARARNAGGDILGD